MRSSGRLRPSPRFLDDAERALQQTSQLTGALEWALHRHGYAGNAPAAARFLGDFLTARDHAAVLVSPFA